MNRALNFHPNNVIIYWIDSPPANVLLVSVLLFIPSSGLPVSPINLTAVTYTLYSVYGLSPSRVYVPVKLVTLTASVSWLL